MTTKAHLRFVQKWTEEKAKKSAQISAQKRN